MIRFSSLAPSSVTSAPPPSLSFQSKLRAPLSRAESEAPLHVPNKPSEFQRQGSLRFGSKRASISHPPSAVSSNANPNRFAGLARAKAKGRENVEP